MLLVMSVVVPLLVGLIVMALAWRFKVGDRYDNPLRVTWIEYGVVSILVVFMAVVVTVVFGPNAARAQATAGYQEFWNGSIVSATSSETPCTRDGSCIRVYNCDPYQVAVTKSRSVSDGKGGTRSETYVEYETRYHRCPYATAEHSYFLADNLGRTITIAQNIFAESPQEWRGGKGFPGDVSRGVPERWLVSKARLEAGDAEPVTKVNEYINFILPSERTLLKQYSESIDSYESAELLPEHTANLKNGVLFDSGMQATKIQAVGGNEPDLSTWHDHLMRFNAALGSEHQGDLHVVVVPAAAIDNPDEYIGALTAYWQSKLGKWGLPKNGIVLVFGISDDATTIEWSRAKTGMPEGNGEMLAAMQFELQDKPFDPDAVFGSVRAEPYVDENGEPSVRYHFGDGILARVMFQDFPFLRACMSCQDEGDSGTGYVYLRDSIPVSTGANILMFFIVLLISLVGWGGVLYLDPFRGFHSAESTHKTPTSNKMRW